MSTKWQLVILLVISVMVHFAFFGQPAETVFDEVHFGKFVSGYYTGQYYFDVHPPLGKLIIAGFVKFFDFKPEYSFTNIGDKFQNNKYLALRFLPTLAGTLLPLVIFLLILELGLSRLAALIGALLIIFDNALLVQSRLILLDPFLLLFGFISLLFYFKYRSKNSTRYLLLTTFFAGLALSIKWTGLSFLALPVLVEFWDCIKNRSYGKFISQSVFFISVPLIIYFSVFAVHFNFLPSPGPGDAFMKPGFRESGLVKNIWDLNIEMYRSNQRLGASHPYGSTWNTWPFMTRPIFYWVDSTPSTNSGQASSPQVKEHSRIYFIGNPIVWWSSTLAVILLLLKNLKFKIPARLARFAGASARQAGGLNFKLNTGHLLLGGYVLNLLPFIGIKRVMFLYHYMAALIFAILIMVYLIDNEKTLQLLQKYGANRRKIFTGLIIASTITFLFFAPLSYGLPLSDRAYEWRVWFAGWR